MTDKSDLITGIPLYNDLWTGVAFAAQEPYAMNPLRQPAFSAITASRLVAMGLAVSTASARPSAYPSLPRNRVPAIHA